MDPGHYNCRDYYIQPHFAPTTISKTIYNRSPLFRHESFQELEQRSRSPQKSKFPLLDLPLELRQQIFSYLLPRTIEKSNTNPLATYARNFSAVKKREARGMIVPTINPLQSRSKTVMWRRGNISLLMVCRQIHDECAELLYGGNTFLLFTTYNGTTFRFNWLLDNGMAPTRHLPFLELLSKKYMSLIRRVIVNVDHVDSYTGMIKYNVSGKGLTHGIRKQVQRLVNALQPAEDVESNDFHERQCLTKVTIRVSNGNAFLDQVKSDIVRQRESIRVNEDLEEMLEPFSNWRAVREVAITGAVNDNYAKQLEAKMKSTERLDDATRLSRRLDDLDLAVVPQLCVYGNDI
ncbi:hypothetical protein AC578_3439 [Pseudocercospora eumusae]|uniref:DUF7730 domain-containing protein n=1 Tax=Pseudocercospora eumusae TaxID=321146 RepID=A0A139HR38_9PEZI|nr:hypothetical protein AC578_3439 [Pseudocercospora eumusae]